MEKMYDLMVFLQKKIDEECLITPQKDFDRQWFACGYREGQAQLLQQILEHFNKETKEYIP